MAANEPHLLMFMPMYNPECGPNDSLVMNSIWQKWWVINPEIRLWEDSGFQPHYALFCSLTWLTLMETSCHNEMNCPKERPITEGGLQPTATEELSPQSNSPWGAESYQEPHEWAGKWIVLSCALRWNNSLGLYLDYNLVREKPWGRGSW